MYAVHGGDETCGIGEDALSYECFGEFSASLCRIAYGLRQDHTVPNFRGLKDGNGLQDLRVSP
jgi:hypothetical protein